MQIQYHHPLTSYQIMTQNFETYISGSYNEVQLPSPNGKHCCMLLYNVCPPNGNGTYPWGVP